MASGPQLCLQCAGSFEATPFRPPPAYVPPQSLAEAGPAGAAPCAVHPGNAALGTCERCGLFACSLCCSDIFGQRLCAACIDRQLAKGALPTLRASFVDLPGLALASGIFLLLFSIFGVATGPLTVGLAIAAARQRQRGEAAGGWLAILVAGGLGLAQLGIGIFFVASMAGAGK